MDEQLREGLTRLVALYSRTKLFILQAEEADPESRANIAIIKEQRDALDHIMHALNKALNDPPDDSSAEYIQDHFDKAWGHLLRAAYDSIDGVNVSSKVRLNDGMRGVSTDAISAVYPEYFTEVLLEMTGLQKRIADFRYSKDINESTLTDLESYFEAVERMVALTNQALQRVPAFNDWQKRDRVSGLVKGFLLPAALIVVTFLLTKACGESHSVPPLEKTSPSASPGK